MQYVAGAAGAVIVTPVGGVASVGATHTVDGKAWSYAALRIADVMPVYPLSVASPAPTTPGASALSGSLAPPGTLSALYDSTSGSTARTLACAADLSARSLNDR